MWLCVCECIVSQWNILVSVLYFLLYEKQKQNVVENAFVFVETLRVWSRHESFYDEKAFTQAKRIQLVPYVLTALCAFLIGQLHLEQYCNDILSSAPKMSLLPRRNRPILSWNSHNDAMKVLLYMLLVSVSHIHIHIY